MKRSEELHNEGVRLMNKGDIEGAIAKYRSAVATNPKQWPSWQNLGVCLSAKEEYLKAIEATRESLKIYKKNFEALLNLSNDLNAIKDYEAAIKVATKGLKIKKTSSLYNNLGNSYKGKKDFEEAYNNYQEGLKLDKNNPYLWGNLGYLLLKQKKYPKAIEVLKKAITLNSKMVGAWAFLGRALYHNRQLKEAISIIEKGLSLPNFKDINVSTHEMRDHLYKTLGLIYKEKGEFERSIQMFQKAINFSPESESLRKELNEVTTLKIDKEKRLNLKITSEAVERLKKLKKMSNKIKLDMLQNILGLDDSTFNENIIKWGEEFNFRIDGDYIIFDKEFK